MYSVNKCAFRLHFNHLLINNKINSYLILAKPQNRFSSSAKQLSNCSYISANQLSTKPVRRCMSTEATPEPSAAKPRQQISRITSKSLADDSLNRDQESDEPTVKPIGIVDIHKWEDLKDINKWICVYHFPYIVHMRTFQRLKLWLTVLNVGLLPVNVGLYSAGMLAIGTFATYCSLTAFSLTALYLFGLLFRRFVGRIYISDDENYVRLSHLSFFGNRVDDDIDKEDVVPLMDTNNRLDDWYCGIERFSTSQLLYMSLKFGGITHREGFEKVFGEDSLRFLPKR